MRSTKLSTTYGRSHTFFETDLELVTHVDFTHPTAPGCGKDINGTQVAGIVATARLRLHAKIRLKPRRNQPYGA